MMKLMTPAWTNLSSGHSDVRDCTGNDYKYPSFARWSRNLKLKTMKDWR
jgi:hypothetical protein